MPDRRDDLIIGAITGYDVQQIWPWLRSLERCGYDGRKAMIVYDVRQTVIDELLASGFVVLGFDRDPDGDGYRFPDSVGEQILVSRFYHVWRLLQEAFAADTRYVIMPDVKDVVFQSDPSSWLEEHMGDKQLNVGSESVLFRDEPWGSGILNTCFEDGVAQHMARRVIYNAGTMAGTLAVFRDFSLQVYLTAAGREEFPDQASANILLSLEPYRSLTRFSTSEDGWACQLGTSMADSYLTGTMLPLIEPGPTARGHEVFTTTGRRFCLVHQYDRVPTLNQAILASYGAAPPIRRQDQTGVLVERPSWRVLPSIRGDKGA